MKLRLAVLFAAFASSALAQDQKISDMPSGSPAQAADMIPIARAGANFRLAGSDFLASAGSALTGSITGPTGCTTPAYSFTANTSGGVCAPDATSVRFQNAPLSSNNGAITIATTAITLAYRNASSQSTTFSVQDGAIQANTSPGGASVLRSTDAGTVFGNSTDDDPIAINPAAAGAGSFGGTITSVDLTVARTYTLPNFSGTYAFEPSSTGFFVMTSAGAQPVARCFESPNGSLVVTNPCGLGGTVGLDIDNTTTIRYSQGTTLPATCTPPQLFYDNDSFELYTCINTDTWNFVITMNVATDDAVIVASGTGFALKVIPDCNSTNNRLNYDTATNAWSCATAAITVPGGGTGVTTIADDQVVVGSGTDTTEVKTVPNCTDTGGNHLNYTQSSNSFSCGTSGDGSGSTFDPTTTIEYYSEYPQLSAGGGEFVEVAFAALAASEVPTCPSTDFVFGCQEIDLAATDNGGSAYRLLSMTGATAGNWTYKVRFQTNTTAAIGIWIGMLGHATSTSRQPLLADKAIWMRYDTDATDANYTFQVCDAAGAAGCQSTDDDTDSAIIAGTVAASANAWHTVSLRMVQSGVGGVPTVYAKVDSETEVTFCSSGCTDSNADMPASTDTLYPFFAFGARDTAGTAKGYIDYVYFSGTR